MMYPEIHTATCGNQYFHIMTFREVGMMIPTHDHTYDHVLQVIAGRLKLWTRTETLELKAGDLYDMPRGIEHGMEALEPNTIAQCIHIFRFDDGTIVPFSYKLSPQEVMHMTGAM